MRTRRALRALALSAMVVLAAPARAQHEPEFTDRGAVGLGLALRRLATDASILYITAHPDDEDNGLIAKLARGRGARVGVLTLTRGEGGQNEIGPELAGDLGVLRTGELLAARRLDGAEQLCGSVVDFGYSFSVEETFEKWDAEQTVRDIVRVLRAFRPDVVITLKPDGAGGGQHHQASALLATRAFVAAGDPELYRDLRLDPWRPRKLYRALWRPTDAEKLQAVEVELGDYDPLLGMSFAELGALARQRHRCQGMNAPPQPGPQSRWYLPARDVPQLVPPGAGLFDGIAVDLVSRPRYLSPDATPDELPDLAPLVRILSECDAARRAEDGERLAARALAGLVAVRRLRGEGSFRRHRALRPGVSSELSRLLSRLETRWVDLVVRAHAISCEAVLGPDETDGLVVAGEPFEVRSSLLVRGSRPVELADVHLLGATGAGDGSDPDPDPVEGALGYNETAEPAWTSVTLDPDARISRPGWELAAGGGRTVSLPSAGAPYMPVASPSLIVDWELGLGEFALHLQAPVVFRWYDPRAGRDRSHAVQVVPAVSVALAPDLLVFPAAARERTREIAVRVRLDLRAAAAVEVGLELPKGWRAAPEARSLHIDGGREAAVRFAVTPPADAVPGTFEVGAYARIGDRTYREGYRAIAYPHIETRNVYRPSTATARIIDVKVPPSLRVGYVMGVGDRVADAIGQLGVDLEMLGAGELASGDLSGFDAIVLGVRAYKDRGDLRAHNQRLLDYVRAGGTLVVQYNKYEFHDGRWAPFPGRIRRPHDRVTDESAPVRALVPEHRLLQWPNRLGAADWEGWVQERGLYFWGEWDERYIPILAMEDSFPYNRGEKRGALLAARVGRGSYVYTGLSLFRQLPAGVDGAYRLLANLLALGRNPAE